MQDAGAPGLERFRGVGHGHGELPGSVGAGHGDDAVAGHVAGMAVVEIVGAEVVPADHAESVPGVERALHLRDRVRLEQPVLQQRAVERIHVRHGGHHAAGGVVDLRGRIGDVQLVAAQRDVAVDHRRRRGPGRGHQSFAQAQRLDDVGADHLADPPAAQVLDNQRQGNVVRVGVLKSLGQLRLPRDPSRHGQKVRQAHLGGQGLAHRGRIEQRPVHGGHAGAVLQQLADGDRSRRVHHLVELRQIRADRRVELQLAFLGQFEHADRHHGLGDAAHVHRVRYLGPGRAGQVPNTVGRGPLVPAHADLDEDGRGAVVEQPFAELFQHGPVAGIRRHRLHRRLRAGTASARRRREHDGERSRP